MRIISRRKAVTICHQHSEFRIFRYYTGKYQWHGGVCHYTDRGVPDIAGVLVVYVGRRQDRNGPHACLMSIILDRQWWGTVMSNPTRGLQRETILRLGARLAQGSNRLHYLTDRISITDKFSDIGCRKLGETLPYFILQMGPMLTTDELSPHRAHCATLYRNDLTCEVDALGSCGYVYIVIYPTQR